MRSFQILTAAAALTLAGAAFAQHGAAPAAGHDNAAHAAAEHAAHETVGAIPTPRQGVATGVTALVVFALTAAFLGTVVWPKISKGLSDREQKIRGAIEEAEMAQKQAREALAQYERNLAQARAEAQKMLDDAKAQQQAIAAELKARSDAELASMRDKAKRDIDAAKAAAIAEIHNLMTDAAVAAAANILRREIAPGDHHRLIQESLQELQTAGRA
jgi:F-type H+-transporting ATPase subunit b